MRAPDLPLHADRHAAAVAPVARDARPPPAAGGSQDFRVEIDVEIGRIAPFGELDLATTGQLDAALCAVLAVGAERIVLDLGGLRFADSSVVHLSRTWQTILAARDIPFTTNPGPPAVQRVFQLVAAHQPPNSDSGAPRPPSVNQRGDGYGRSSDPTPGILPLQT